MAVVVCRICDGKQFKTEDAYRQHAKTNMSHLKKAAAQNQPAKTPPVASKTRTPAPPAGAGVTAVSVLPTQVLAAKPGYCKTCKADFGSTQNLEAHFNSGEAPYHPKCTRCSKGFENHAVLEMHRKIVHPIVFCQKCAKYMYREDWVKHEADCSKPPMWGCPVCPAKERSEEEIKKHIVAAHAELCCYACELAFDSKDGLANHYWEHEAHPKCTFELCEIGFHDFTEYEEHMVKKHQSNDKKTSLQFCFSCEAYFTDDEYLHHSTHGGGPHDESFSPMSNEEDEESPFQRDLSPEAAYPTSSSGKGKEPERSLGSVPELIVPRTGTIHLTQSKSEEEFYSDASSDSVVEIPSAPGFLRTVSAPTVSTVSAPSVAKPIVCDDLTDSPEKWTTVQLTAVVEVPTSSESPDVLEPASSEQQRSTESSPVLVPGADTIETDSPLSSATSSTSGYHSVAGRIPSPRAISRLSLHTAYRHISAGDSPASESTSGLASPASAQSLLFTLSQQIKGAKAKRESGMDASGDNSSSGARALGPMSRVGSKDETQSPIFAQASSLEDSSGPESPDSIRSVLGVHGKHDAASGGAVQGRPAACAGTKKEGSNETTRVSVSVPGSRTSRSSSVATNAEKEEPATVSSPAPTSASRTRVLSHSSTPTQDMHRPASIDNHTKTAALFRFQCRVCAGNPVEPTVTMCGHLFCRSCIVAEITKNLQCPVCRMVMLVRLHVD